ncbi:hypothetical protein AB0G73_28290 [Streptomyces sp. NPDC020719]|uniref:hypothetical protein n=1 Tax=Streptomyces sp. NPDC020719 TaxID=3154896 RepID=UPI0033F211D6
MPLAAAAMIISQAVSTALRGPGPVAFYTALLVGALWAWEGFYLSERSVSSGVFAQHLTWDGYVRPHTAPETCSPLSVLMADRMRQTEQYVAAFARRQGLVRISLALPGERHALSDARSTRHGRRGHLWLGHHWFLPRHTHHLAPVLEHELAHIRRYDTRTHLAVETAALTVCALAAGLLPTLAFVLTALSVWIATVAVNWYSELACDAAAVRACGREPVAAMWSADIAGEHTVPLASRVRNLPRSLPRHPPLRLRRIFARHAPLRLAAGAHPLLTAPERVLTAPHVP